MIAGPDSHAQIAIQAAQRWRDLGAGVPWDVAPPLPVWLIAWLSAIPGVTPNGAYIALVVIAFAASAWAVFRLWRVMGAGASLAAQAALLALLAPSGWIAILERGEIDRLLFWKLVPLVFLAVDVFRRKPNALRVGLILVTLAAMALTRSSRFIVFDALALAEWIALFVLCRPWQTENTRARLLRLAGVAAFVAIAVLRLASVREPGALGPMPASLVAKAAKPAVGPVSLDARLRPAVGQVHELINGDFRPRESVLWLQALGAQSVIAPAHGKFARYLECVAEEEGWCVFDTATPAPPAVLVSRERFQTLQPIRGLFDIEGLERYLTWASRPEAVGFERENDRVSIRAKAGPDDLILVRLPARDWTSSQGAASAELLPDPVGYTVLEPSAEPLELVFAGASQPEADSLHSDDYPRILPEGVIEATAYAPPPFAPGAHVSIFGERFRPDGSQVLLDGADCPVAYLSATQINIQLPLDLAPGPHELVVNSANRFSYPYRFEVTAR